MKSEHELEELTPRRIVEELDKFIVGQADAKRVVAIALRNRTRRRRLEDGLREEVIPKNIIMIGPTGVGKTEIARRMARLVKAPFVKVEATKYTEVGYVGRDVESMVRDLIETSISMVREEMIEDVNAEAQRKVRARLLKLLEPRQELRSTPPLEGRRVFLSGEEAGEAIEVEPEKLNTFSAEEVARRFDAGELEQHEVEFEVTSRPPAEGMFGIAGVDEQSMSSLREMMEKMIPGKKQRTRVTVEQARKILMGEELDKLLDQEKINRLALDRAEQSGIIFIDEIDKVAAKRGGQGPDVSREGVQRDILPIVEGSTVFTKYGPVKTDHVLFIAAGAFHISKPSDLIPELQGRFPLRVELKSLTTEDLRRILTEPRHSLVRQYIELLRTDGVQLTFADDALDELAAAATKINAEAENIGARRLYGILERVLEDISFEAPDQTSGPITIDAAYVREKLGKLLADRDMSRFIL